MENLTLGQIIVIGGSLMALAGTIGYFTKPVFEFLKRLQKVEEHQENDLRRLDNFDKDIQQILLSVDVLLQHSIDGNNTEELKKRKRELNSYLIQR